MHKHLHIDIDLVSYLLQDINLFVRLCTLVGYISILSLKDSKGDIAKYLL